MVLFLISWQRVSSKYNNTLYTKTIIKVSNIFIYYGLTLYYEYKVYILLLFGGIVSEGIFRGCLSRE